MLPVACPVARCACVHDIGRLVGTTGTQWDVVVSLCSWAPTAPEAVPVGFEGFVPGVVVQAALLVVLGAAGEAAGFGHGRDVGVTRATDLHAPLTCS